MSPNPATATTQFAPKNSVTEKARKAALAEINKRLEEPAPASPKARDGGGVRPTANPAKKAKETAKASAQTPPAATSGTKGGKTKPAPTAKPSKMGGLDAAAKVLAESKKAMRAIDMYAEIEKRGLWKTLGKTPEATIYAAIIREIAAKGKEARFKKTDRGMFIATGKGN